MQRVAEEGAEASLRHSKDPLKYTDGLHFTADYHEGKHVVYSYFVRMIEQLIEEEKKNDKFRF